MRRGLEHREEITQYTSKRKFHKEAQEVKLLRLFSSREQSERPEQQLGLEGTAIVTGKINCFDRDEIFEYKRF